MEANKKLAAKICRRRSRRGKSLRRLSMDFFLVANLMSLYFTADYQRLRNLLIKRVTPAKAKAAFHA